MSVRTGERTQGDLTVIVKAKEMVIYTLRITNNEKNFPKRYRLSVVNKIQDKAFEIVTCLIEANEIYPRTKAELQYRQMRQRQAMAYCRSLMATVDICKELFSLSSDKVAFWAKSVFEVRTLTAAWFKKDEERFKDKFK
ncbi:four helix bundle protein [Petralouisia muris]|uniref:Four helix bundle protein n=1 Tax=Petralouisia muris TaxID=3032872 RepID=A0AC61RSB6_9FIRM|nr:four helix bundle protein [Petralouisia muris]TGY93447.1 four helix bundle protein [Petralouisia muris]